jgi:hypothetical protein
MARWFDRLWNSLVPISHYFLRRAARGLRRPHGEAAGSKGPLAAQLRTDDAVTREAAEHPPAAARS